MTYLPLFLVAQRFRRRLPHRLAPTWPAIGGSALRVTTSLFSSNHWLPEHNSKFPSAARD